MRQPRMLICGCLYGAGNIGDEAILLGLLELLPKEAEKGVCAIGHHEVYRSYNMRVFDHGPIATLLALIWADVAILGGATLLSDPMGFGYPVSHCARILELAEAMGRPVVIMGIGATRLHDPTALLLARRSYGKARKVFVRNEWSRQSFLDQVSTTADQVVALADPAFFLRGHVRSLDQADYLTHAGIKCVPGRRMIAVSVVNEGFEKGRDYLRQIAQACDALSRDHKCDIVFVYSEIRAGNRYDQAAALQVKAAMTCPWQELKPDFYNPLRFARLLGEFDCLITMRMHVAILGSLCGVPIAAIVREEKVMQTLSELELQAAGDIDTLNGRELTRFVLKQLDERPAIQSRLEARVDRLLTGAAERLRENIEWSTLVRGRVSPLRLLVLLGEILSSRIFRGLKEWLGRSNRPKTMEGAP